jgi:PKD repeat protein/DNA-binding MarR family transcriptional regulator
MERGLRALGVAVVVPGIFALLLLSAAPAGAASPSPELASSCSAGLVLQINSPTGPAPLYEDFVLTSYWGVPVTVSWNFGDGSSFTGSGAEFMHPTHRYSVIGQYEATVSVAGGGRTGACSVAVDVTPPTLSVSATALGASGLAPLTVHFVGSVLGGTGTFRQLSWSFGDGNSAPGFNLTYTYTVPGVYRANFVAVDSANDTANATVVVQVLATLPHPVTSSVSPNTLGLFGAVGIGLAASAGAALYVRGGNWRFSNRRKGGPSLAPPTAETSDASAAIAPVESSIPSVDGTSGPTAIVPYQSLYPPEMYRGVFLDLSDREFDVLAVERRPAGPASAVVVAPSAKVARARTGAAKSRLSHRVLLHLASLPRLGPDDIATNAFTQAGMVEALGIQQSTLSNVLRRLTYSGLVVQEVGHVQGVSRRVNIYRLTPKGETFAARLRARHP